MVSRFAKLGNPYSKEIVVTQMKMNEFDTSLALNLSKSLLMWLECADSPYPSPCASGVSCDCQPSYPPQLRQRRVRRARRGGDLRHHQPSHRTGGRHGTGVLGRGRGPGLRRGLGGLRGVGTDNSEPASAGAAEVCRCGSQPRRGVHPPRVGEHGQAVRTDSQRRATGDGGPDPVLRRCGPGPGGALSR